MLVSCAIRKTRKLSVISVLITLVEMSNFKHAFVTIYDQWHHLLSGPGLRPGPQKVGPHKKRTPLINRPDESWISENKVSRLHIDRNFCTVAKRVL